MEFGAAVTSAFRRYFDFSTRSSRSEYWWFVLFSFIAGLVLGFVDGILGLVGPSGIGMLGGLFSLALIIPSITLGVRRLHDIGKSGWWYLLWFVPIIGWIILIWWAVTRGDEGPNQYGDDPLGAPVEAA